MFNETVVEERDSLSSIVIEEKYGFTRPCRVRKLTMNLRVFMAVRERDERDENYSQSNKTRFN